MHLQPRPLILLWPEPLPAWPLQFFFLILLLLFVKGEASSRFEMASVLQENEHASLSWVPPHPLGSLRTVSRVLQFPERGEKLLIWLPSRDDL